MKSEHLGSRSNETLKRFHAKVKIAVFTYVLLPMFIEPILPISK